MPLTFTIKYRELSEFCIPINTNLATLTPKFQTESKANNLKHTIWALNNSLYGPGYRALRVVVVLVHVAVMPSPADAESHTLTVLAVSTL
jgi:hypothetical protein